MEAPIGASSSDRAKGHRQRQGEQLAALLMSEHGDREEPVAASASSSVAPPPMAEPVPVVLAPPPIPEPAAVSVGMDVSSELAVTAASAASVLVRVRGYVPSKIESTLNTRRQ